ncbi:MAG: YIP1 family protein [Anaerolineae bacterium]|nr:YIP1 family protein [Anaerolineae bacterium]
MSEQAPQIVETAEAPASFPWSEAWQMALLQPSVETYGTLIRDPKASTNRGFGWVCACTLIGYVISALLGLAFGEVSGGTLDVAALAGAGAMVLFCGAPVAVLITVIALAISAAFSHLIARALGGRGTYGTLIYAIACYAAPMGLLASLIGAIPYLSYLVFVLSAYAVVLNVIAIRAVHGFGWGKAIVSSGVVLASLLVCIAIVVIAMLLLLGPVIGDVFSNIVEELLLTPVP